MSATSRELIESYRRIQDSEYAEHVKSNYARGVNLVKDAMIFGKNVDVHNPIEVIAALVAYIDCDKNKISARNDFTNAVVKFLHKGE